VNGRRLKLALLLAGIALAGLTFLGWTQEWFVVALTEGQVLSVGGETAAPALSILALTCLVLIGALTIAGPFFRVVLGLLESGLGLMILVSTAIALSGSAAAAAPVISHATGVSGKESTGALVATIATTAWPWISLVAGSLLVALGLTVVATVRAWPSSSRKYTTTKLITVSGDSVEDWDALSAGDDPTASQ
jgi:hypothetical protein